MGQKQINSNAYNHYKQSGLKDKGIISNNIFILVKHSIFLELIPSTSKIGKSQSYVEFISKV